MNDTKSGSARRSLRQAEPGKRFLLWVGLVQELVMMAAGLWPAVWLVLRFRSVATTPGHWVLVILGAVLLFNYGYLAALLAFRIVVPRPKEGLYAVRPGAKIPGQVILFMLNVLLVKARYDPPWAAMFSSVLANTFPLRVLFNRLFGPRTRSLTLGDTIYLVDPHMVEIGRNVQLGFHCTIAGHVFDNRRLYIRKVKIDDHAVIGGESVIGPGVQVGHHAVIDARAVVYPNTIIRPYEYWSGAPAKKAKDLTPGDEPPGAEVAPDLQAVAPPPDEDQDAPPASASSESTVLHGQE